LNRTIGGAESSSFSQDPDPATPSDDPVSSGSLSQSDDCTGGSTVGLGTLSGQAGKTNGVLVNTGYEQLIPRGDA